MSIDWKLVAAVAWIVASLIAILILTWPVSGIIMGTIGWVVITGSAIVYMLDRFVG